jgi:glycosyltransferase involved in cell wall biosynthesis
LAQSGTPRASIIIPCFNHGQFVGEAVASAVAQTGADTRVVLVNDGSTDESTTAACDACGSERVLVLHQPNLGLPAARNCGAALAIAEQDPEFLVFLDADDWIEPSFVARLAGVLPGSVEVSHAYCQERLVGLGTGVWEVPEWDPLLLMVTNLHPVTALVRRDCFESVGGFSEDMRGGYEDWDLWLKFAERGWRGVRISEPLFVWRRHSDSTMVMNAIHDHEALYRQLMANHAPLYQKHALDLVVLHNGLMHRFDANWLDEDQRPINFDALKRAPEMYESMVAVRLQRRLSRLWSRSSRAAR